METLAFVGVAAVCVISIAILAYIIENYLNKKL